MIFFVPAYSVSCGKACMVFFTTGLNLLRYRWESRHLRKGESQESETEGQVIPISLKTNTFSNVLFYYKLAFPIFHQYDTGISSLLARKVTFLGSWISFLNKMLYFLFNIFNLWHYKSLNKQREQKQLRAQFISVWIIESKGSTKMLMFNYRREKLLFASPLPLFPCRPVDFRLNMISLSNRIIALSPGHGRLF